MDFIGQVVFEEFLKFLPKKNLGKKFPQKTLLVLFSLGDFGWLLMIEENEGKRKDARHH